MLLLSTANLALGQAQLTGTSTISILSNGTVLAYGTSQLDYASAVYYNVGVSVALFAGPSGTPDSGLSFVGQQDAEAQRGSVSAQFSTSSSPNMIYETEAAHYAELVTRADLDHRKGTKTRMDSVP